MNNEKGAADFCTNQQPRNPHSSNENLQQTCLSVKDNVVSSTEQNISFTLIEKTEGILTKRMKLIDGNVEKDSSECRMNKGTAETVTLTPEEFGPFLQGLQSNQALVHGVCAFDKALIVSGRQLTTKPGDTPQTDKTGLPIIARTKDFYLYPTGPGLLMLDHDKARDNAVALDPEKALKAYSPEELINAVAGFTGGRHGLRSAPPLPVSIIQKPGRNSEARVQAFTSICSHRMQRICRVFWMFSESVSSLPGMDGWSSAGQVLCWCEPWLICLLHPRRDWTLWPVLFVAMALNKGYLPRCIIRAGYLILKLCMI